MVLDAADTNLLQVVEKLDKDPIFHMSLASNELFHSNMFAWLVDNFRDQLLPHLLGEAGLPSAENLQGRIHREKRNLDLIIPLDNILWVIENKFKSIPGSSQLDGYIKAGNELAEMEGRKARFSLLAPRQPHFFDPTYPSPPGEPTKTWTFLGYDRLSSSIRSGFSKVADSFEKELALRYADMVDDLLTLYKGTSLSKRPQVFDAALYEKGSPLKSAIEEANLDALISKWRFEQLAELLREALGLKDIKVRAEPIMTEDVPSKVLFVYTGFSRNKAMLDVYVRCVDGHDFGIQLQHDYLRLSVVGLQEEGAIMMLRRREVNRLLQDDYLGVSWKNQEWAPPERPNRFKSEHFYFNRRIQSSTAEGLLNLLALLAQQMLAAAGWSSHV